MTSLDAYITLGRSGLRVSPLCLGAMTFGEDHGWGASVADSEAMISAYLDRGGNFIDTANVYTGGHSELIIGDYLSARPGVRDRIVLATKFYANLHPGDPNGGGTGRKALLDALKQSLRRLQTDYIDIYWIHNWDRGTPVEETLRTLDDLVSDGVIRYVGFSDLPAWVAAQAQTLSTLRGWSPAIALQTEYSLLERTSEGELIPMAEALGMGVMPWSPLHNGHLSGKYRREDVANGTAVNGRSGLVPPPTPEQFDIIETLETVAGQAEASMAATALAWVRQRHGIASTLLGVRTMAQLESNLGSLEVNLTPEQMATLDAVSAPRLNFPAENHATLAPRLAFGGMTVDGVTHADNPLTGAGQQTY